MIQSGLSHYRNKRVLLLQGPVGPFFSRFANDLRWADATVFKVNFNGGDSFFYGDDAIPFRDDYAAWPAFFKSLLERLDIEVVMLFGDCRKCHVAALEIARERGLEVGVFEEGYLRPDYVTLERQGVNGNSGLPTSPIFYLNKPSRPAPKADPVGNSFFYAAWWACVYTLMAHLLRPLYPHYQHHRRLSLAEAWPWSKALWRKFKYAVSERGIQKRLVTDLSKKYFLVPLQVHHDAQIRVHSEYESVEQFIVDVVASFARSAPANTVLVIKHHPLDRGHRDYTALLRRLGAEQRLGSRLVYVHDQNLPKLLDHARGVIVINSTVGLSALLHKAPLKVCGDAIYKLKGLVYQGELNEFWGAAAKEKVDMKLFRAFRDHVIQHTQLNGSFYRRLSLPGSFAGMRWEKYLDDKTVAQRPGNDAAVHNSLQESSLF